MAERPSRVWIDLTNSPHVVFFRPIIRRLREAGVEPVVTARDFAQTLGLLELYGIPHTRIGQHGGRRIAAKAARFAGRAAALAAFARRNRVSQAVSHGSPDMSLAARVLGLHTTVFTDYEGATAMHRINFRLSDKVLLPAVIPYESLLRRGIRNGGIATGAGGGVIMTRLGGGVVVFSASVFTPASKSSRRVIFVSMGRL